jgi:hypothetical protein
VSEGGGEKAKCVAHAGLYLEHGILNTEDCRHTWTNPGLTNIRLALTRRIEVLSRRADQQRDCAKEHSLEWWRRKSGKRGVEVREGGRFTTALCLYRCLVSLFVTISLH